MVVVTDARIASQVLGNDEVSPETLLCQTRQAHVSRMGAPASAMHGGLQGWSEQV
jgi:hypothetical protein